MSLLEHTTAPLREDQMAADGEIRPDRTVNRIGFTTRLRTDRILRPLGTHRAVSVRPFRQLNTAQQQAFALAQTNRLDTMRARLVSERAPQ